MAAIHFDTAPLQQRFDRAHRDRLARERRELEFYQKRRIRNIVLCCIALTALAGLFVWMLCCPEAAAGARPAVKRFLDGLCDRLMAMELTEKELALTGIVKVLYMAGIVIWTPVRLLLFAILWVAALIVPWIVWLLIYAFSAVGAIGALLVLFNLLPQETVRHHDFDETKDVESLSRGALHAIAMLEALGDDCHVFLERDARDEADHCAASLIAVAPGGVTLIDVKNHSGKITGDLSDTELHKYRRGHESYSGDQEIPNPVLRCAWLKRETEALPEMAGVPVRACVLFANEKVTVMLEDAKNVRGNCPVFLAGDDHELAEYVQSGAPVNGEALRRVLLMLESCYGGGMSQTV